MDNVAAQIADYKLDVKQGMLLAILQGVFSMDTTGGTVAGDAAAQFIANHVYDITAETDAKVGAATLNKAIQKACGDNKNIFKLVVMHSEVATNIENMKLLTFMTQTDADGIERQLALATWNGRLVLIDDNMPTGQIPTAYAKTSDVALVDGKTYYTRSGSSPNYVYTPVASPDVSDIGTYYEVTAADTSYTTYILGDGSIILDDIGDAVRDTAYIKTADTASGTWAFEKVQTGSGSK
jgi:hypothetical protein